MQNYIKLNTVITNHGIQCIPPEGSHFQVRNEASVVSSHVIEHITQ
jgi:hypothetical protein